MRGFEPPTFGTTIRRSNQLNYIHHVIDYRFLSLDYRGKVRITDFGLWITGEKYGLQIFSLGSQDGLLSIDNR